MAIHQSLSENVLELRISGELDINMSIDLDEVIKEAYEKGVYKVSIDCSELEYISSAGLGVFVSYLDDFMKMNGRFVFYNMSDKVYHVFQILGLHNIMTIVEDKNNVLELFDEG